MAVDTFATLGIKVDPKQAILGSKRAIKALEGIERTANKIQKTLSGIKLNSKGIVSGSNRSKKALAGIGSQANATKKSLSKLKLGMLAFGAASIVATKSAIKYGMVVEDLRVKLTSIYQDSQEASKAFEVMLKFSQSVPFTFQEIGKASGSLALVTKDMTELQRVLRMTADISAGVGMPYLVVAGQIQRAFSAGIATVELFRERGVSAMFGFVQGVKYTAKETKKMMLSNTSAFAGASAAMARTLTGKISMLGDAWDILLLTFSDAGAMDSIKKATDDIKNALKDPTALKIAKGLSKEFSLWVGYLSSVTGVLKDITYAIVENNARETKGVALAIKKIKIEREIEYIRSRRVFTNPTRITDKSELKAAKEAWLLKLKTNKLPPIIAPTTIVDKNWSEFQEMMAWNVKFAKSERAKVAQIAKLLRGYNKLFYTMDLYKKKTLETIKPSTSQQKVITQNAVQIKDIKDAYEQGVISLKQFEKLNIKVGSDTAEFLKIIQGVTFDKLTKSLDKYRESHVRASSVLTKSAENALDYKKALKQLNKDMEDAHLPLEKVIMLREKLAETNKLVIQTMQKTSFDEMNVGIDEYLETHVKAAKVLTESAENALDYKEALKQLNETIKDSNMPLEQAIILREKFAAANKLVVQTMQTTSFDEMSEGIDEYLETHTRAAKVLTESEKNTLDYSDALKQLNKDMDDARLPLEKVIMLREKLATVNKLVVQSIEEAKLDKMVAKMADSMETSITDMIMNIGQGVKSLKDVVTSMTRMILAEFVKIRIAQPIAGALSAAMGSFFGGGGRSVPIVDLRPPTFAGGGFTGNAPRSGGVDGRGGFPAILHPRETVIDHTKGQQTKSDTINNITVNYSPQINALDPRTAAMVITENAPIVVSIVRQAFARTGQSISI